LLWRSSVTNHKVFSQVELGQEEDIILTMIKNDNPGDKDDFATLIGKYDDSKLCKFIHSPHKISISKIYFYQFFISGQVFYIKVDNRRTPELISDYILAPEKPLYSLGGTFDGSRIFNNTLRFVNNSNYLSIPPKKTP
ncbi:hypothetical protein ACFL6P_07620, partial [Candidatus Latescibacterota bacterium]